REIRRLGETGSRQAAMLAVMQTDLLADRRIELLRELLVARAEVPDLRRNSADHIQRQLAFIGLADPALLRELLQNASALALGVRPREREPGPQPTEQQHQPEHDQQDAAEPPAPPDCQSVRAHMLPL